MKMLGIIPARRGSTRLPGKNMKRFNGKPLVQWTIEAAKESNLTDVLVTSNWYEVLQIGNRLGCLIRNRPDYLCGNKSTIEAELQIIADKYNYDKYMLLNPTSPLRTAEDINGCIRLSERYPEHSIISVKESFGMWWMRGKRLYSVPWGRTQDVKERYEVNGAIFVFDRYTLSQGGYANKNERFNKLYVMPVYRSFEIDTEEDFLVCEFIKRRMK